MAYAEECGFDWVGCNEHHFSPYGLMSNCNLIGAALVSRTKKIKLGMLGNHVHGRFGGILGDLQRRGENVELGGKTLIADQLGNHDARGAGRFGVLFRNQFEERVDLAAASVGIVGTEYCRGQIINPIAAYIAKTGLAHHVDDRQRPKYCQRILGLLREQRRAGQQRLTGNNAFAPIGARGRPSERQGSSTGLPPDATRRGAARGANMPPDAIATAASALACSFLLT